MNTIFKYEWKLFVRNKIALLAWSIMLLAGLYAVYYGRSFHASQLATITRIDTAYQNRVKNQLDNFSADTTVKEGKTKYRNAHDPFLNEYYTRPMVWKYPHSLQALTIGQSDNQPFYYNIWVYNNVYNTRQVELRNPSKLLAGNFDLAFVIIYLLPLLVIASCYNVLSADREAGITGLLSVQGLTMHKIVSGRLLFRGILAFFLILLLSITGFAANGIYDAYSIFCWLGIALSYLVFWITLIYAVVSAKKSSSVTALVLVGCWVIFLLVIPSLINNFQRTEDAGRIRIADADREFSNQLWEMDKKVLIDTLLQVRPDWRKFSVKDTNEVRSIAYSYLDMLNMNRVGKGVDNSALKEQQRLKKFNFINPAFCAQLLFNKLARSEIEDFVAFRNHAAGYQLQRSEIINDFRLSDKMFDLSDYQKYPVFTQIRLTIPASQWVSGSLPLLLFCLISIAIGQWSWATKS